MATLKTSGTLKITLTFHFFCLCQQYARRTKLNLTSINKYINLPNQAPKFRLHLSLP